MLTDYKFLIVVVLCVIIIFILLKELGSIKKMVYEGLQNSIMTSNNNVKLIQSIVAQENEACVDKINLMNSNLVAQVRRMNEYGNQPITKMMNHYSDSGSLNPKRNAMANNLSEFDNTGRMYYMSDDKETKEPDQAEEKDTVQRESYFEIKYKVNPEVKSQHTPKNETTGIEVNEKLLEIDLEEIDQDSEQSDGASVIASKKSARSSKSSQSSGSVSGPTIDFSHRSDKSDISLQSIRNYKLNDLKEIAEKHNILTYFYNANGKKVFYKKSELYDVIKYANK